MKSIRRPTYPEIQPLVEEFAVYRPWLHCTFVCPATGFRIRAKSEIQGEDKGGRGGEIWSGLKSVALTTMSALMVGMTGDLKGRFGSEQDTKHNYSDDQIHQATVDAFLTVRGCFRHNGEGWVSKEKPPTLSALERQVKEHPVQGARERDLLTRCLAGLAAADGQTCHAEQSFLQRFAPAFERQESSMPNPAELFEIREKVRPTVYLLAVTLAMVDRDYSTSEREYLVGLANGLGLTPAQVSELRDAAGEFLVQQSVRHHRDLTEEEVSELSKLTAMSIETIQRTVDQYRKSMA